MLKESVRLEPIECQALKTIDKYLSAIKVHLIAGTANQEQFREALIEASALLGDIAYWIAEDNGIAFKSAIETRLMAITQIMEKIAVDDFPEPPEFPFDGMDGLEIALKE